MTTPISPDADREQRLHEVLLAFVEAAEQGLPPDRRQFLTAHPEFAAELAEFFSDRDRLERLAAPLRGGRLRSPLSGRLFGPRAFRALDLPVPGETETAAPPAPLGQLGDFRLLREVGRGGMGIVYEAEQISLNRRVALKVLPFAAALDPKQLQRFKNEAQAAALLHHPNIVPVYAVGCERGVHYYAMQFIEGQSLSALIQGLARSAEEKTLGPALSASSVSLIGNAPETASVLAAAISTERSAQKPHFFRRVAQLGVKAAQALEHGHQLGVVHRDIKPGNLLLDAQGNLWITDFGLALLRNNAALTISGELVGTLRYMSPEQASARRDLVDHRTDIYSLGVTLYELLTLKPLFESGDSAELLHLISAEDPRPPRSIDRTIPVELETIILKALAKAPAERYASAQELADDLERFLGDQPVRARRPTLVDRVRKWSRRHKSVVVSGVVLLLAAVSGLLISTVLIAQAHSQVKKALFSERQKADEAEKQQARAEANFVQARKAIDFLTRVSAEELVDEPDILEARRKLLETALQYYEDFIDQHQDDPSIQEELASSRARVAEILDDLTAQQEYLQLMFQVRVLASPGVQKDLKATGMQKAKFFELFMKVNRELFRTIRPLPEKERGKKSRELAAANEKVIAQILKPDQARRLKQIVLQLRGPLAFSEPEVADTLHPTPDQKAQIKKIQDRTRRKLREPPEGQGPWAGNQPQVQRVLQQAVEHIQTLLDAKQKEAWKTLVGETFRGDVRKYLPGSFGPYPMDDSARGEGRRQGGHGKWGEHNVPTRRRPGNPGYGGRNPERIPPPRTGPG